MLIKKRELFTLELAKEIADSRIQVERSHVLHLLPFFGAIPLMIIALLQVEVIGYFETSLFVAGLFTVASVSYFLLKTHYQKAKARIAKEKNQFNVFLQTELLPNTSNPKPRYDTFVLQQNLETFNERFTTNMEAFHNTVLSLNENHKVQRDFVEKLEKLSLNEIGNFNMQVIERFENVILKMHKFENWFEQLNENTEKTILLSKRLDHLFDGCRPARNGCWYYF